MAKLVGPRAGWVRPKQNPQLRQGLGDGEQPLAEAGPVRVAVAVPMQVLEDSQVVTDRGIAAPAAGRRRSPDRRQARAGIFRKVPGRCGAGKPAEHSLGREVCAGRLRPIESDLLEAMLHAIGLHPRGTGAQGQGVGGGVGRMGTLRSRQQGVHAAKGWSRAVDDLAPSDIDEAQGVTAKQGLGAWALLLQPSRDDDLKREVGRRLDGQQHGQQGVDILHQVDQGENPWAGGPQQAPDRAHGAG